MRTLLLALALVLTTTIAYSADLSGTYKIDGWDVGNLVITGDKFSLEVRDNEPETFCIVLKNGIIKQDKVYQGNKVMFNIKQKKGSIQLLPKDDSIVKVCNGSKVIENAPPMQSQGYIEAIPNWKLKKIK